MERTPTTSIFNQYINARTVGIPIPFLELDLNAGESWFAAALAEAGLQGDMMGCPDREGGHRMAWIVDDIDAERQALLEARLRERYAEVHTALLEGGRWVATGRILDGDVMSPALHAYMDIDDRFEAPWIHMEGSATLRLLPRSDLDLLVDEARLRRALRRRGVDQAPRIRSFQLSRYDTLRRTLHAAVLGQSCREPVQAAA